MMDYDIIGAIKIKDGLFLGDEYAAQDLEFIVTNKVTRIINCASKQIPNHWEAVEVSYLSYGWLETDSQVIFDNKDEVLNQTYNLIEETLENAESILVHSIRGQNRSICVIAAYLMKKYRWTLYKTLEFLHSRRQDLEIKASFFNQLLNLENRLTRQGFGAKSYNWKELSGERHIDNEEFLLTNTFLNAKIGLEDENNPDVEEDYQNKKGNNTKNKTNKGVDNDDEDIPFDLKKPDEIEDFDLNSFDGESDSDEKEKKKQNNFQSQQKTRKSSIVYEKDKDEQTKSKQTSNKIRKIVWNDEDGNKSICSLEIPPYEQCQFKRKSILQKQSFYRSILKGSNKIFQTKPNKIDAKAEKNDISNILNSTNQINQSNLNPMNTSGNGIRKIGSMKQSFRNKKAEDAQQEKRVIMQKMVNSQKDIPAPPESVIQKCQSFSHISSDDNKVQNSLNTIANKQLKEVMAKYDQPQVENENIQLDDIEKAKVAQSQGQGLKDKRRKITRKEFQQLMQDNKIQPHNSNGQQQQEKLPSGENASNQTKVRPLFASSLGSRALDQLDEDFGFGFSKVNNILLNSNIMNMSNTPNSTSMIGSSSTKDFGFSLSSKNFFNNQNIYPSSTGNGINASNPAKFSIKNSFKSTQKIYQNSIVKPQSNNFVMGQARNTADMGFQIQKLGNRVYSDDKKFSRTAKAYSRPSTAPQKQNPYQRIVIGNQIKPTTPSQGQMQIYSSQPFQQQQQQSFSAQQIPLSQFPSNIPQTRQSSLSRNGNEESARKSLRSNSAGQQSFPIKNHQFGFFQSHKPRWKF